jgi:hypothetical protein
MVVGLLLVLLGSAFAIAPTRFSAYNERAFRQCYGVSLPTWYKRIGPITYRLVGIGLVAIGLLALVKRFGQR